MQRFSGSSGAGVNGCRVWVRKGRVSFQAASAAQNRDHLCVLLQCVAGAYLDFGQDLLHPLREYDRLHGGDLVRTLCVYLTRGWYASRTAEYLYLHRSGLIYRLARIQDLLGLQLDNFEHRLVLELATVAESGESQR